MNGFLKIIVTLVVIAIVIISSLLVLGVVDSSQVQETLQKVLLVLAIFALGGVLVSFLAKPKM